MTDFARWSLGSRWWLVVVGVLAATGLVTALGVGAAVMVHPPLFPLCVPGGHH